MTPIPYALIHQYLPQQASKVLDMTMKDCLMIADPEANMRMYKAVYHPEQALPHEETLLMEDIFCTDASRLPFLDENFHVVLHAPAEQELLEHVQCLRECVRVLRPGGLLVACLSGMHFPSEEPELRQELERFGIELLERLENNHFIGRKWH